MKISNCKLNRKVQVRLLEFFVLEVTARSAADLLDKRMTTELVCNALSMAIRNQKPPQRLIVHSLAKQYFSGSQYCSHEYRNMLEKYGFQGSMSKKTCGIYSSFDNAPIESFWGILKNELVHHHSYKTRDEAKADITKYIELFYNQQRIQKGLDFKTPNQVAEDFYKSAARISQVEVSC